MRLMLLLDVPDELDTPEVRAEMFKRAAEAGSKVLRKATRDARNAEGE